VNGGRRVRAFRFVHPDLTRGADSPSAGLQVDRRGRLAMVEDEYAIRQSLLMLLSTSPGERVMRPEYGCDLRRLVFAPNDDTTAGLAIHYVRRAVERWEPRIEIESLDAGRHEDRVEIGELRPSAGGDDAADASERLIITLDYRVRATRRQGRIVQSVDLTGETI
jgi:phage baseplate assembly protein W